MPGSSSTRAEPRQPLRPLMHREIAADAVAGAVVEVEPASHSGRRASGSRSCPRVPLGKRAVAMAICAFSTSV